MCSTKRQYRCIKFLAFVFVLIADSCYARSASFSVGRSAPRSRRRSIWAASTSRLSSTNSTIRIVETERFTKNGTWVHESWTDAATKESVEPPSKMNLNATTTWLGEWKIVVSSSTSRHGWKYSYDANNKGPVMQYTIRQRIWLRGVQCHYERPRQASRWIRAIKDDWNFKGFGISLYKSMLFPRSKGISFRLPLTYNFGIWERHPALPSFSLTVSVFHPPVNIYVNGNLSIRMRWLQWALSSWSQWLPAVAANLLILFLRGIAVAVSAMLYPITRRPLLVSLRDNTRGRIKLPPPQYSQSVEEWVGVTWSWIPLVSLTRIHATCWHFYALQLAELYDKLDWIPRHSAALGWSIVGPVMNSRDLWCTASLCLSLSGFYFRDLHKSPGSVVGSSKVSSTMAKGQTKTALAA